MIAQDITLDYLIEKGNEIIQEMYEAQMPDNLITASIWYDYDEDKYMQWEENAKRFLSANYNNDRVCDDFQNALVHNESDFKSCIKKMVAVLKACKCMPTPIKAKQQSEADNVGSMPSITINNSNTQSQTQSVSIFIEAIKDDLTGKQVKELKEIVSQEGDDLDKAKPKILEKVISWGGNVAAGIVTNLLTNPAIWGGL